MNELIEKIEQWAKDKELDTADSSKQMLKVMEELGEVAAAIVRSDRASLRDGIGDTVVTLIILAMQNDMNLYECVNCAYDEIKNRTGEMINGSFVKSTDLEKFWTDGIAGGTPDVVCRWYVMKNPDYSELAKVDDTNAYKILGFSEYKANAYRFSKEEFESLKDVHPFNDFEWEVIG